MELPTSCVVQDVKPQKHKHNSIIKCYCSRVWKLPVSWRVMHAPTTEPSWISYFSPCDNTPDNSSWRNKRLLWLTVWGHSSSSWGNHYVRSMRQQGTPSPRAGSRKMNAPAQHTWAFLVGFGHQTVRWCSHIHSDAFLLRKTLLETPSHILFRDHSKAKDQPGHSSNFKLKCAAKRNTSLCSHEDLHTNTQCTNVTIRNKDKNFLSLQFNEDCSQIWMLHFSLGLPSVCSLWPVFCLYWQSVVYVGSVCLWHLSVVSAPYKKALLCIVESWQKHSIGRSKDFVTKF